MSDISLADVTIHMDTAPDADTRGKIEAALRNIDGVVSVHHPDNEPHAVFVEYNPAATKSSHILEAVREIAGHSEMISL